MTEIISKRAFIPLLFVALLSLAGLRGYSTPQAAGQLIQMTPDKWRADLHRLADELPRRHVNLFRKLRHSDFEHAVAALDKKIPEMTNAQITVALMKLVAKVGDGHTSLYPDDQRVMVFRYYPVEFFYFDDGIYVVAAQEEYANLIGRRLLKIGKTGIDKAYKEISSIIAADNDNEYRYTVPDMLWRPEVLQALGIVEDCEHAPFVFEGLKDPVELHPVSLSDVRANNWKPARQSLGETTGLGSASLLASPWNIKHIRSRDNYWFTEFPESKAVYMQYNACWDQPLRPKFAAFAADLFKFLDAHPDDRLIVDLRQNPGGEPAVAKPLIDGIAARPELNRKGRVFVLVWRRTFSAALTNAAQLKQRTAAIFVGEPPRGRPNSPSEGRGLVLSNSRTAVSVSTQFLTRLPANGDAPYLPIDLKVGMTFEQYRSGKDTALEAALAYWQR